MRKDADEACASRREFFSRDATFPTSRHLRAMPPSFVSYRSHDGLRRKSVIYLQGSTTNTSSTKMTTSTTRRLLHSPRRALARAPRSTHARGARVRGARVSGRGGVGRVAVPPPRSGRFARFVASRSTRGPRVALRPCLPPGVARSSGWTRRTRRASRRLACARRPPRRRRSSTCLLYTSPSPRDRG